MLKHRGRVVFCVLLILVLSVQGLPAWAATKCVVSASSAKLYAQPSGKAKAVSVKQGQKALAYESNGNWVRIKIGDKAGYMLKQSVQKVTSKSSKSISGYKLLKSGNAGAAVLKLQKRLYDRGYLGKSHVNGKYGSSTALAVRQFQMMNGLTASGKATVAMQRKLFASGCKSKPNVSKASWYRSGISSVFDKWDTAWIVDIATGTRIRIRRTGGSSHADVEPCTKADTAKLKRIYGGTWSWDSRGVLLVASGKYYAAAINGMPHGEGLSSTNGFYGKQICLHLFGSKTHGSDSYNAGHQKNVMRVYNYFH